MTVTSEQAREIIRWGNQHRRMLRENYRRQFVAYSATQFLSAGTDYHQVIDLTIDNRTFKAPVAWLLTEITNAPLLLGREVVFDLFDVKFVQAEQRIEFDWRGKGD